MRLRPRGRPGPPTTTSQVRGKASSVGLGLETIPSWQTREVGWGGCGGAELTLGCGREEMEVGARRDERLGGPPGPDWPQLLSLSNRWLRSVPVTSRAWCQHGAEAELWSVPPPHPRRAGGLLLPLLPELLGTLPWSPHRLPAQPL